MYGDGAWESRISVQSQRETTSQRDPRLTKSRVQSRAFRQVCNVRGEPVRRGGGRSRTSGPRCRMGSDCSSILHRTRTFDIAIFHRKRKARSVLRDLDMQRSMFEGIWFWPFGRCFRAGCFRWSSCLLLCVHGGWEACDSAGHSFPVSAGQWISRGSCASAILPWPS